jgi:glycine hydroxymethyltransferase
VDKDIASIEDAVDAHHRYFAESLPMIASENLISPLARELLLADFQDRYAEGLPGERYYQGNQWVDQVEVRVTDLAKRLFACRHADVRPISGTNANLAVLFALTRPGDAIASVALSDGAHISTAKFGAVGVRGVENSPLPWDAKAMNIDVDAARKHILALKPKVVLLGQSVYLFPTPVRELADAAREAGATVWYDAAHVLGLIAGGQFQDPLREGADVMTGSTHKTLPGPQHGILLSDSEDPKLLRRLQKAVFPGLVSNHHLHAMAALGVTLAEHLEFGRAYAAQVVRNAQALGQALHDRGLKVLGADLGFTRSHTIAVDVAAQGGGAKVAEDLERAHIVANKNLLPADTSAQHPSGIRLGSQELTRIGMGEGEMAEVASLIARVTRGEDPAGVKAEVRNLRARFPSIRYCYLEGAPAHARFFLGRTRSL